MKTYTEEDLRRAFIQGATDYCKSPKGISTFLVEDVDKYIDSLNITEDEEDFIDYSYSFLRRKLGWEDFCALTGISLYAKREGSEIKDSENFSIRESKAKKFNLI